MAGRTGGVFEGLGRLDKPWAIPSFFCDLLRAAQLGFACSSFVAFLLQKAVCAGSLDAVVALMAVVSLTERLLVTFLKGARRTFFTKLQSF